MTANAVSTDVRFTDDVLADLKSFADVQALFVDSGVVAESIEDYGNGFKVCKDKNSLVGVPFAVIEWRFNDGDYKDESGNPTQYVAAYIMTKNNDKMVLVDGGSGICAQLRRVSDVRIASGKTNNIMRGLLVSDGLTRSDYTFTDAKGIEQPATTFYLSE